MVCSYTLNTNITIPTKVKKLTWKTTVDYFGKKCDKFYIRIHRNNKLINKLLPFASETRFVWGLFFTGKEITGKITEDFLKSIPELYNPNNDPSKDHNIMSLQFALNGEMLFDFHNYEYLQLFLTTEEYAEFRQYLKEQGIMFSYEGQELFY